MKEHKKRRRHIVVKSLFGIILLLAVFSAIVGTIGYREFSATVLEQYEENAFYTADTATHIVFADQMDAYAESGGTTEEYRHVWDNLSDLCNSQGATFVYVIRPDRTDYGHITFLFSTINKNSPYECYSFGYLRETTNDEYREKYRALYEKRSDKEVVIRDKGIIETDPHITAMIPLIDSKGSVQAILCVQRQMERLYQIRHDYVNKVIRTMLFVLLFVIAGQGLYLYRTLISPIRKIMKEARRFASENVTPGQRLSETIRNNDEIGILAEAVDQMEEQIHDYVENVTRMTAENERISAELSLASRIQNGILPNAQAVIGDRREVILFAKMDPAKEVSGDFYDFFFVDEDHLALVVADVSGKGIPAALFMMVSKTLIKNCIRGGDSPGEALSHLNNLLIEGNRADMFVTVWLAEISLSTGKGIVANAGHEHPAIHRTGSLYELASYRHSPPVALMADIPFREHEFEMRPGDSFFVYTDGVAEAVRGEDDMFGAGRMLDALNTDPDADPADAARNVEKAIQEFVGDEEQFDDITMLCLKYLGPQNAGAFAGDQTGCVSEKQPTSEESA
ncbi:MAG: SpoIIE family protein phosphatase [Lachnospiraceae bacterium]|nr:SpoIIE family protein phosphatase [Lachnospiraceae bacterium]